MNENDLKQDGDRLGELLRESRLAPSLPPRFQQNVWRRIENEESRPAPRPSVNWLDIFADWILRPRLALTAAAVLVLAGVGLGWSNGWQLAQTEAQNRYLTAVAHSISH